MRMRPRPRSPSRSSTSGRAAGSGRQLLAELSALALDQGILRFRALIAHGNRPAFALVHGVGDELGRAYEDGAVELVVRLV